MLIFDQVAKAFGGRTILDDLSFRLAENRILAILGPSGIGKTTILRLAAGTLKPDAGQVLSERQKIGFIFQEPRLLPWRTALANVTLVLKGNKMMSSGEQTARAAAMLEKMELAGFEHYYPAQLSGGMRQRVAIARAFVIEPDLLLLDEPFAGLDLCLKESLQQMLGELLAWRPASLIYVTHEPRDAALLADEAIILAGEPGRIRARIEMEITRAERTRVYIEEKTDKMAAILTSRDKE